MIESQSERWAREQVRIMAAEKRRIRFERCTPASDKLVKESTKERSDDA